MSEVVREAIRKHRYVSDVTFSKIDKINWDTDEKAKKARKFFDRVPDYSLPARN